MKCPRCGKEGEKRDDNDIVGTIGTCDEPLRLPVERWFCVSCETRFWLADKDTPIEAMGAAVDLVEAFTAAGILSVQHRLGKLREVGKISMGEVTHAKVNIEELYKKEMVRHLAGALMREKIIKWDSHMVMEEQAFEIQGAIYCHPEKDLVRIRRELRTLFAKAVAAGALGMEAASATHDDAVCFNEAAHRYGGGFIKQLGKVLVRADTINLPKVAALFPDEWKKYVEMGKEMRQKDADPDIDPEGET